MRAQVSLLREGSAGSKAETEAKGQKADPAHKACFPDNDAEKGPRNRCHADEAAPQFAAML